MLRPEPVPARAGQGLIELIATAFVREGEKIVGFGLAKGYQIRTFTRPPYPGVPDATAHLARYLVGPATEPFRTLRRFGEVRTGVLADLEPEQAELLARIIGGPVISVDELTGAHVLPVPAEARTPPKAHVAIGSVHEFWLLQPRSAPEEASSPRVQKRPIMRRWPEWPHGPVSMFQNSSKNFPEMMKVVRRF